MTTPAETSALPVAPSTGGTLADAGLHAPWLGAGVGAALGAGGDLALNGFKNWRRTLRRGLTGAATGVGAQLGLGLGGELARRHAINGGSDVSTGVVPVLGTLAGAGAGYALSHDRSPEGEEDDE